VNNYERTAAWLAACGKQPTDENLSVQIGCFLEEVCEMLQTLRTSSDGYAKLIDRTTLDLEWFSKKLTSKDQSVYIPLHLRTEALDALCDIEVTLNGIAYLANFKKSEADALVLDSNDAKLVNGKPIMNGGKIGKPADWQAPDLKHCV
jgi:hypothetical protein